MLCMSKYTDMHTCHLTHVCIHTPTSHMCACILTYMHAVTYTCTCPHMHTLMCTHCTLYTHIHIYTIIATLKHMHMCTFTHLYTHAVRVCPATHARPTKTVTVIITIAYQWQSLQHCDIYVPVKVSLYPLYSEEYYPHKDLGKHTVQGHSANSG